MSDIFISYTSKDIDTAKKLYTVLCNQGYLVWFAPRSIPAGADFAAEIGSALAKDYMKDEDIKDNIRNLSQVKALILILSGAAMKSEWVMREVNMAINEKIPILPVRIDHTPLTPEFSFMLSKAQIIDAYHMQKEQVSELIARLNELNIFSGNASTAHGEKERKMLCHCDMNISLIAQGDPYFISGETLKTKLSGLEFFIAPPIESLDLNEEQRNWVNTHISKSPKVFDTTWDEIYANIPIEDLKERIDASRKKVLLQFINHENGCYFNNLKFGINRINPFERTEDLSERAILSLEFFTTDYYTHRVMKDVCIKLIEEGNDYLINGFNFLDLTYSRIFFTSLGINLMLLEDEMKKERELVLTSRSKNAAKTEGKSVKKNISVSVIEGISYSDYDPYTQNVNLISAVNRGVLEELGVSEHMLQSNTLKFYDFFVNKTNFEMGLSCSIELKKEIEIKKDIFKCHGKDEQLEISDKIALPHAELRTFIFNNYEAIMPQALYTMCSYLESIGDFIIERFNKTVTVKEKLIMSKQGHDNLCGDIIVDNDSFIAVIDGATPKGNRLWNGMRGDVYIAHLISDTIHDMDKNISAEDALLLINERVKSTYSAHGLNVKDMSAEERLQASLIIYSAARHEIWSFGDCQLRINHRDYNNIKKLDSLMSDLRTFFVEMAMIKGEYHYDPDSEDYGRNCILPYLKEQNLFANTDYSFGYDVIDGGDINIQNIKKYIVQSGDRVVMASDGYPKLFDSLDDTEKYLNKCLKEDPECLYSLKSTKGVYSGNISYDDRSYIGFTVE